MAGICELFAVNKVSFSLESLDFEALANKGQQHDDDRLNHGDSMTVRSPACFIFARALS